MATASIAVIGATGYTGSEVIRLLRSHPCATVQVATSSRSAGKKLRDECPWLDSNIELTPFEPAATSADVTFLCQESGFAMKVAPELMKRTRIVDLSADFRLKDMDAYRTYYKAEHSAPGIDAVYGLPELVDRERIADAAIVANPGCYPTTTLLALMPLVRRELVTGTPIIDAKSGVSGSGRSKTETQYLFTELDGGFKAYSPLGHRHTPEIEQMVGRPIRFTPHLLPFARGLHATVHVPISDPGDILGLFREFYTGSPFVTIRSEPPNTKEVLGSNRCAIWATYEERTGMALVCSVTDNLVKGAAGQAVQNMNLMLGYPEALGLPLDGVWP